MRSSDWEYLGYVLVGIGGALVICGSIAFVYFQQPGHGAGHYSSYPILFLAAGICIVILGTIAFRQSKEKRHEHEVGGLPLPPPPPSPLPPPPPPPNWTMLSTNQR